MDMPVDPPIEQLPPMPGQRLQRGVCRGLRALDFVCVEELVPCPGLRVDVMALGPRGEVWVVECKSGRADYRSDRKWQGYLDWCDRYFWAGEAFPASNVSLRSIGWDNFVIIDTGTGESLAELDYRATHTMLHEQAIYQHDAEQYQVEHLDFVEDHDGGAIGVRAGARDEG